MSSNQVIEVVTGKKKKIYQLPADLRGNRRENIPVDNNLLSIFPATNKESNYTHLSP